MINRRKITQEDPGVAALREQIREQLPYGSEWLDTPHEMLGGQTPEQQLMAGKVDSVRNLFHSILYIGIT